MRQSCPIVDAQINEKLARLISFGVFITSLIFLLTPAKWIILVLALDFFLRAYFKKPYSPLCLFCKFILEILKIKQKIVNAGPKKFAAKIGF